MAVAAVAAAENKNETTRPLAVPSPSVHPAASDAEEEAQAESRWRSAQSLRKRRRALWCCGCCVTTLVVVGLAILVLALTVFRVKDPRTTMNGVWVTAISTGPGSGGPGVGSTVATNATLTADISVKNPNIASLRFSRSETDVYYKGKTVSVAYVPAGEVGADRTVRMNVTIDLLADRLASVLNGTGLILGQEYDLSTYTDMKARVNVLGIIKKNLEIRMNCSIILDVSGIAGALVPGGGAASGVQTKGVDCVARVSY
uniref:Late embryogenesis abundant protein LEA-2 subgroup domain-containing protein n=1 Tax=Oryza brachyantha TaxID=4533 RepID=J3M926_ORYBR